MAHLSRPEGSQLQLWAVPLLSQRLIRRSLWCERSCPVRGIHLLWCALLLMPGMTHALDCPSIPEQARKDWEVEIRSVIGNIGTVKGAELETLTRSTTRDLMSKLPQADKIYLEQMMYATFCSALRDDTALTESQKSTRIKAYNLEMRKTLYAAQTRPNRDQQKTSAKDAAREELARIPLPYTSDAFIESAKNGDLATVKLFLTAGMDPNAKVGELGAVGNASSGWTALMYAAAAGQIKMVETLLKSKANINAGLPPAAWNNRKEVVRLLLDHGANTQAINDAFLSAARAGHLDILHMLVKRGADKNLANEALRLAASGVPTGSSSSASEVDQNSVIHFLLELGADTNAKDDEGWTALPTAVNADTGRASVVQTLLDAGADINAKCTCTGYLGGGWTALMIAVHKNDRKAMVDMLLAQGADPSLANNQGATPLTITDNMDTVRALLDRGANVNAKDKEGVTALMLCSYKCSVEKLRLLLEKNADVNAKNNEGATALLWAATAGNAAAVEVLLDAGADLHAKSVKGRTALMLAIREERVEAVHTLLRKGAKVNDEDAIGKTPLNYAEEDLEGKARIEMMRILKKAGAK